MLTKELIKQKRLVSGETEDHQFQPAGVDLSLKKVFRFKSAGKIDFDNKERALSEVEEIPFDGGWMKLEKGAYKVVFNEVVSIPQDCVGLAFPRSSLLRCGCDVHCAVWDPGYTGKSESLLVVENAHGVHLKEKAKLIQIVFMPLVHETKHSYSGRYKGENME